MEFLIKNTLICVLIFIFGSLMAAAFKPKKNHKDTVDNLLNKNKEEKKDKGPIKFFYFLVGIDIIYFFISTVVGIVVY